MITVHQASVFIRKHGLLKKWKFTQLISIIEKCVNDDTLAYGVDGNGHINSIVLGTWKDHETIHIHCMIGRGQLRQYVKYLKTRHPFCKKISAERDGKTMHYYVDKLPKFS